MKTLELQPVHGIWVHVVWKNPGTNKVSAVRELKELEDYIRENNLPGWVMQSEQSHKEMHKIIKRLGGVQYHEDSESKYFMKEVK